MTVPTLYNFTEALQAPDLAFSTLRDCHPRRTATGGVALSRTSRFAEAEIEWQSRKYLLCFPLSTASIFAVEQTAARLRYLRTPLLTEYTILRDEMTYTDDTGTTRTCDVVLHRLPEGRPLSVCAAEFDAESCGRRSINWRRDCPSWASATTISNPATSTSPPTDD